MSKVYNYMELLVSKKLEEVVEQYKCCTCEQCKKDIYALALNQLPPKYVVTEQGEAFTKLATLEPQIKVHIIASITRAITQVMSNKRHD